MEITSTSPKKDEKTKIKSKKKSHPVKEKKKVFDDTLEKTIEFEFHGTINELVNSLKDQEKRFLNQQTVYELQKYKAIVQKILKTVMDDGFTTMKLKRRRREKADFIIIKDINIKLEEIAKYITSSSNKAFNVFKKIEEIRGLILDLVY